ncbi:MAG TPA: radical SAM protein [Dehalococcoidia bacterium]|jgi:DNA repair photolyase
MARVSVQEVACRSALNRVRGMPFKWSLNPYRGCAHGCHYCYARATHRYLNLDSGAGFSAALLAKINIAEVLRRELSARAWRHESISLGTATDPYQPIEGRYRLSRACLRAAYDFRTPVSIVTKGTLVLRDADVLEALAARGHATVCVSVPTVDRVAARLTEPGTPSPAQRLRVVERLVARGIHAGVMMAPLLPGITADEAHVAATVQAAAEHGARLLWTGLLHLDAEVRLHYLAFLRARFPELLDGYARLYRGKYAPAVYAERVVERTHRHKAMHGLGERYAAPREEPHQLALL